MRQTFLTARRLKVAGAALILGAGFALSAYAQTAPAPGPSAARQAIEARKAVFTLIGSNCRALGDVVKGNTAYDATDVQKRIARIAFLSEFVNDAFPDVSNTGEPDTKTKPEAWTDHADFSKKVKDFQEHSAALVRVNATEKGATDGFKTAFAQLAQDCKGCHETYRVK